jgi:sec-independent protein translocase protein TatA
MPNLGAPELIIIALVILLLFGASRLPKLGRSLGQGIGGFKQGLREGDEDDIVEIRSQGSEQVIKEPAGPTT